MTNAGRNQQIEFEVFPKENKSNYSYLSGVHGEPSHDAAQINVVFSHQSVIIIFICTIMLLVAAFSLGVEKGKLVARNTHSAPSQATPAVQAAPVAASPSAPTLQKAEVPAPQETPGQSTQTAVVAAVPEAPRTAGGYAIQVASVKSESAAKKLAETLTKKGISAFTRSSGSYVVVLAGNFAKKEEAQASLKELKKTYADCFVRKI